MLGALFFISDVEREKYKNKTSFYFCISEPRSLYRLNTLRLCAERKGERSEHNITLCSWHRGLYVGRSVLLCLCYRWLASRTFTNMGIKRINKYLHQLYFSLDVASGGNYEYSNQIHRQVK